MKTCAYLFSFLILVVTSLFADQPSTPAYTVVEKPCMFVIGISCRTSNTPEGAPKDIPALWNKFCTENVISQIPNKASSDVVGLYCDYEGDYTKPYTLVIGCPVTTLDTIPEGMVGKMLPASSYAQFLAVGEQPTAVIEMWHAIWKAPLPRTYTGDFEVYTDRFLKKTPQEVDIFIAIQ